jgi:hypothetical protein
VRGQTARELLQFIIVVAFGVACFGCGYLTAFIVTRNRFRDEMIKRGRARYDWQTGTVIVAYCLIKLVPVGPLPVS